MSAQPADAHHSPRPQPTVGSVRAALPPKYRQAFNDALDRATLDQVRQTVADWDLRARALSSPAVMAMAQRLQDERAGRVEPPPALSDDEVRALMPSLRP